MSLYKNKSSSIAMRSDSIIEARYFLTAKQNDLLDMLLCEIKEDDQFRYEISVEKYASFYKTDTSNLYRDMKKAAKLFEGKGFRLINKETKEEIYYAWFSKIHYVPRQAVIKVNVDLDFKKLLCEVKKRVYYDIQYSLNFSSNYSKRVYYYIKSFEDTGWRIDKTEDLLKKLECPPSYSNYSDFKRAVLEVSKNEINKSSDIAFDYEPIKEGNKVARILFRIYKKDSLGNIMPQQSKTEGIPAPQEDHLSTDKNTHLLEDAKEIIKEKLSDKDIRAILKASKNNLKVIKEKYELMKRQKYVDDITAWLIDAIRRNYHPNDGQQYKQQGCFNNFEQRDYDYKQLEADLLGL